MKRYRPSTKLVMIGVVLMLAGVICWCIEAPFKNNPNTLFLFPLGLLFICSGGLELTITAFITLRKNDLAARKRIEEAQEKNKR